MLVDGGPGSMLFQPRMHGDKLQVVEDFNGGVGDFEPQLLAHQPERRRIQTLFKAHMAVAVKLGLGPCGDLDRHIRQRAQHRFFRFGKQRERLFVGGAVDAVAGSLQHPAAQLAVGICHGPQRTQRKKSIFHILDP